MRGGDQEEDQIHYVTHVLMLQSARTEPETKEKIQEKNVNKCERSHTVQQKVCNPQKFYSQWLYIYYR